MANYPRTDAQTEKHRLECLAVLTEAISYTRTIKELARATGVSQTTISRIARGLPCTYAIKMRIQAFVTKCQKLNESLKR